MLSAGCKPNAKASKVIACEDYIACKSERRAKDAGKTRLEGKEYVVRDGDVMQFRFNV